jgi:diacylglycerol kinase
MPDTKRSKKLLHSFRNAFRGIFFFFSEQRNARIHAVAAAVVITAGVWLGISVTEWCILAICIVSVIGMEMINTAVEYLADVVSPAQHPLIGKLKDIAAGAVLVVAMGSLVCGLLIILVPLLKKLQ